MASSSEGPVAVLGATGQLGTDLLKAAREAGVDAVGLGHEDIEVTDAGSVREALEAVAPRAVVNSAAFHQVDRCEETPEPAFRVNAVGALHVSRAAAELGARVLYVSTDYVFDGSKPAPAGGATDAAHAWTEGDAPRPLNAYGASKLAGEHATRYANADSLVCRVSSLFGVSGARGKGGNFIETILKHAAKGGPLKVVDDQWMTPTYTLDAARAILRLADHDATGVVHVTNPEACTWHALASRAVALVHPGVAVNPCGADEYPSKARRPANSALNTDRLAKLLGEPLRPWRDAVEAYLREKGHL